MTFPGSIPSTNPQNIVLGGQVGIIQAPRDPTSADSAYAPGVTEWRNTVTGHCFKLVSTGISGAVWDPFAGPGSGNISTINNITGDGSGNFTISTPNSTLDITDLTNGIGLDVHPPLNVATGGTGRTSLTNHSVLVGAGVAAITQVTPSSTSGAVFLSPSSSSDPAYSSTFSVIDSSAHATISNPTNTANSDASFAAIVAGTSAGDPYNSWTVGSTATYAVGVDTPTSGQPLKLTYAAAATGTPSSGSILLQATSSGTITKPLQPAFLANLSAPTTNDKTGDGTLYTVVFNSTSYNIGSAYNTGTGIFTAPVTGYYFFFSTIIQQNLGVAHNLSSLVLVSTGASAQFGDINSGLVRTANAGESNTLSLTGTVVFFMTAGDTAHAASTAAGSTKTIGIFGQASPFSSFFGGYLLG